MKQDLLKSVHAYRLATVIGAILLGLACSRAINFWSVELSSTEKPDQTEFKPPATAMNIKTTDYSQLARTHLFGKVAKKGVAAAPKKAIKAPETRLKLQLIGVIFDSNEESGFAIIAEQGKKQKTYHVGDKLPGEARLFAIEKGRIILDRNSRHETLTLKKLDTKSGHLQSRSNLPTLSQQRPRRLPVTKRKTKFM